METHSKVVFKWEKLMAMEHTLGKKRKWPLKDIGIKDKKKEKENGLIKSQKKLIMDNGKTVYLMDRAITKKYTKIQMEHITMENGWMVYNMAMVYKRQLTDLFTMEGFQKVEEMEWDN